MGNLWSVEVELIHPAPGPKPMEKYAMNDPITPQQDHDRRIGRLEGIAEQAEFDAGATFKLDDKR